MTTLSLVDYFMSGAPEGEVDLGLPDLDRAISVATAMTQEALAEFSRLEALDLDLGERIQKGGFDRQAALLLTSAYEEWADRSDALLRRIARLHRRGHAVPKAGELRDDVGRTRAMLKVGFDDLNVARAQLDRGEGIPGEVVRRELLARIRA
jgi:hypothetical protein